MKRTIFLLLTVCPVMADGQVVVYDGSVMPEFDGWQREGTFDCDRWIEDGWFHQFTELGDWALEPIGEGDFYRTSLADFAGVQSFFIEWRVETDIPNSILDVSGVATALAAGGNGPAFYHTTITDERVQLLRDTDIPLVFVDIEQGVFHTYRIELTPSSFTWLIDDEVVHSGVPEGPYPTEDSRLVWGSRHYLFDNTCRWDYLRYGVIPEPATGLLVLAGAGLVIIRRFHPRGR